MKFEEVKKNRIKMFDSPEFLQRIKDEDPRMKKYLGILKKINMNGFITLESQAGLYQKIVNDDGDNVTYSEKSYITGFMEESKVIKFMNYISLSTDKICLIIHTVDNEFKIPSKYDIPLTIRTKDNISNINTHTSTIIPQRIIDMYKKEIKINKSEKIIHILCYDPRFNRDAKNDNGLFTEILTALKI